MANISIKKDFEDGQKLFAQQLNNNFETIELGINSGNKLIWKDDNGAEFQTFRGTTEEIENRPIIDGQELYNIENGDTFLDVGETRKDMNKPLWKDDNGAQVQSFRGTTAEVAARPIIDGQTLYNIETGETALDVGDKRISTGAGNVVYIGDEEPQNDATKIWIENDQVLNLGSEVAISSEEPTTQEKVWIEKGRNLFNMNKAKLGWGLKNNATTGGFVEDANWLLTEPIPVEAGKSYFTSGFYFANGDEVTSKEFYDKDMNFILYTKTNPMIAPENAAYMFTDSRIDKLDNPMIIQGTEPIPYEPYKRKIHTKTDNGYEEFYNEEYVSGAILYSNTNGFTDDLTLGKDLTKYKTLEIYYKDNDNRFSSVKVNVGDILISLCSVRFTNSKLYVKTGTLTITYSNGSFNLGEQRETNFSSSGTTVGTDSTGKIYITKIVGNM